MELIVEEAQTTVDERPMWLVAVSLAFGTFISEDLSALTGAGFVALGQASPWLIGIALFLGIWLGDIGLYLVGRYGRKTSARLPGLRRISPNATGAGAAFSQALGLGGDFTLAHHPWIALATLRRRRRGALVLVSFFLEYRLSRRNVDRGHHAAGIPPR